jgi:hypothetical protein
LDTAHQKVTLKYKLSRSDLPLRSDSPLRSDWALSVNKLF